MNFYGKQRLRNVKRSPTYHDTGSSWCQTAEVQNSSGSGMQQT